VFYLTLYYDAQKHKIEILLLTVLSIKWFWG